MKRKNKYLSNEDLHILNAINQTENELEYTDVLQAFETTAKRFSSNFLVSYQDRKFSYSQCANIATSIANELKRNNVKKDDNVAILVPRSEWYVLAPLGVLTYGSAYVPIDDKLPNNRISFMIEDTSCAVMLITSTTRIRAEKIISNSTNKIKLIEVDDLTSNKTQDANNTQYSAFKYHPVIKSDNAFIVYTSGTTGQSKAIQITRGGIINCAQWYVNYSQMNQFDVYALYSSFGFDMHMVGIYSAILCGASIDIVPDKIRLEIESLNSYFVRIGATHTYLPTQIGRMYALQNFDTTIKFLLVIGEKLGELVAPNSLGMCESYGPTETLAFVTAIKVNDRKYSNSIGCPIYNTKIYILDKSRNRVSVGDIGELYISTHQISNGYLNRKSENNSCFFDNPFDGDIPGYELMYKTGDLVKILPDHTIGFVGRKDSQVKIRGNRVELSEVENTIRELDYVKNVFATTYKNHSNYELVAYVILNKKVSDTIKTKQQIIDYIAENKPNFMVPSSIEFLDSIPLNINGKVDVNSLPKPTKIADKDKLVKADTMLQHQMIKYACKALGIPQETVGTNTNLSHYGLDSISAIRITYLWKDKCNINCPAYEILKFGSIDSIIKNCCLDSYRPIQTPLKTSSKKTLYFVHPRNSSSISYMNLINGFTGKFNFSCIENYNFYHLENQIRGYKNLANLYVDFLLEHQNQGPYYLGGWSCGGSIVFEMANILKSQKKNVEKLYLLDPIFAQNSLTKDQIFESAKIINDWYFGSDWSKNITKPFSEQLLEGYKLEYFGQEIDELTYQPSYYDGQVVFFKASEKSDFDEEIEAFKYTDIDSNNWPNAIRNANMNKPANGFENFISDLKIIKIPTEHDNFMFEAPAKMIAEAIEDDICN